MACRRLSRDGPGEGVLHDVSVVADDPEQALEFIREFEPPEIRDALKIEEVVELGSCADPKGVYWTTVYHFYPED